VTHQLGAEGLLVNRRAVARIIDRLSHHSITINLKRESLRLREKLLSSQRWFRSWPNPVLLYYFCGEHRRESDSALFQTDIVRARKKFWLNQD
jgi:hypothetical protein